MIGYDMISGLALDVITNILKVTLTFALWFFKCLLYF